MEVLKCSLKVFSWLVRGEKLGKRGKYSFVCLLGGPLSYSSVNPFITSCYCRYLISHFRHPFLLGFVHDIDRASSNA